MRRAASPVLPLGLVTERGIAVTSIASFLLGVAMTGTVMFLPLFAQGVLGATAPEAGSTIAAMLIGWPVAAVVTFFYPAHRAAPTVIETAEAPR